MYVHKLHTRERDRFVGVKIKFYYYYIIVERIGDEKLVKDKDDAQKVGDCSSSSVDQPTSML